MAGDHTQELRSRKAGVQRQTRISWYVLAELGRKRHGLIACRTKDSRASDIASPRQLPAGQILAQRCFRRAQSRQLRPQALCPPRAERPRRPDQRGRTVSAGQDTASATRRALRPGQGHTVDTKASGQPARLWSGVGPYDFVVRHRWCCCYGTWW